MIVECSIGDIGTIPFCMNDLNWNKPGSKIKQSANDGMGIICVYAMHDKIRNIVLKSNNLSRQK